MPKKINLSLSIPTRKKVSRSLDSIRVVVLDFDQTVTTTHTYYLLEKCVSPSMLGTSPFMSEKDKERVQSLFSFFERNNIEVYIASRNYRDVVIKWFEHIGITLLPHQVWTDRGLFFHPYDSVVHTSKYGCFEHLIEKGHKQDEIMYIDDDNKEVRHARMSYSDVFTIEKPHDIPLTEEFILFQF